MRHRPGPVNPSVARARTRGVPILARSLCRELFEQGYQRRDIIHLATALLDQLIELGKERAR